jgi:hypothetical protein
MSSYVVLLPTGGCQLVLFQSRRAFSGLIGIAFLGHLTEIRYLAGVSLADNSIQLHLRKFALVFTDLNYPH